MAQTFDDEPTFTPGALIQLFAWDFVGQRNRRLAVSPDGQRFLLFKEGADPTVEEDAELPQVIVVENWFEKLKQLVPIP